jgi:hypothetical protein
MDTKILYAIIILQLIIIIVLFFQDSYLEWFRLRKIKRSGDAGEKRVSDYLDNLDEVFHIFNGIQGRFDNQNFEIDHLLLVHQGVILVETKNIRGTIVAKRNSWCQIKRSESGKSYERNFRSPINQIDRTARIFESFLDKNGIRVKLIPVVVFSVGDVELKLPRQKYPVIHLENLKDVLSEVSRDIPLTTRQLRKLKETISANF